MAIIDARSPQTPRMMASHKVSENRYQIRQSNYGRMDTRCIWRHPTRRPSDPTQFSRFAWKMLAIHWADARVKRSSVYSRINFDDRKKSNKQMTEEVAIRSGARILEIFSPEQTVRSTIIHLFHMNNQLFQSRLITGYSKHLMIKNK